VALTAVFLSTLGACTSREEQIEKCEYLVGPSEVDECLVSRYNWKVEEAIKYRIKQDSLVQEWEQRRNPQSLRNVGYELLDRQGNDYFATIYSAYSQDTSRVRQFGAKLCGSERPCTVRFWTQRPAKVFTIPLAPDLQATQVAEYSQGSRPGTEHVFLRR
jgi:hypothetical protein